MHSNTRTDNPFYAVAPPPPDRELLRYRARQDWSHTLWAAHNGYETQVPRLIAERLLGQEDWVRVFLDRVVSDALMTLLTRLWEDGWQPDDIRHLVVRRSGRLAGPVAAAIVEQARRSAAFDRAPAGWLGQLRECERVAGQAGLGSTTGSWRAVQSLQRAGWTAVDAWSECARLTARLRGLPRLGHLVPPPSAWTDVTRGESVPPGAAPASVELERLLRRIRGLLAKAEATSDEAEAEAFTAKAQDLMTRHAIDALTHAEQLTPIDVISRRVPIDDPYVVEKAHLLAVVAQVNRCQTAVMEVVGIATVVGTPVDIDLTETLYTSLSIQAAQAMTELSWESRRAGYRSRSFRRSFLRAYAQRVLERLTEADQAARSTYSGALVPALGRRRSAVAEEFTRIFPHTTTRPAARPGGAQPALPRRTRP